MDSIGVVIIIIFDIFVVWIWADGCLSSSTHFTYNWYLLSIRNFCHHLFNVHPLNGVHFWFSISLVWHWDICLISFFPVTMSVHAMDTYTIKIREFGWWMALMAATMNEYWTLNSAYFFHPQISQPLNGMF